MPQVPHVNSLFQPARVTRPRVASKCGRILARDGEWARCSGSWAAEKLSHLENFMAIFTGGMHRRWEDRLAYVDLMAGPGLCSAEGGLEFQGSPLRALQTRRRFQTAVFVEKDPILAASLHVRSQREGYAPDPVILQSDCNALETVHQIRRLTHDSLTLVFIDLLGFNVSFETIRALTSGRPMDLVITFPEQDIARNFALAFPRRDDRFDDFFGTDKWREVVRLYRRQRKYSGKPVKLLLLEFYAQRLKELGYAVDLGVGPMRNSRRVPLYRPVFASKHPRGIDFWNKASRCGPYRAQKLF